MKGLGRGRKGKRRPCKEFPPPSLKNGQLSVGRIVVFSRLTIRECSYKSSSVLASSVPIGFLNNSQK